VCVCVCVSVCTGRWAQQVRRVLSRHYRSMFCGVFVLINRTRRHSKKQLQSRWWLAPTWRTLCTQTTRNASLLWSLVLALLTHALASFTVTTITNCCAIFTLRLPAFEKFDGPHDRLSMYLVRHGPLYKRLWHCAHYPLFVLRFFLVRSFVLVMLVTILFIYDGLVVVVWCVVNRDKYEEQHRPALHKVHTLAISVSLSVCLSVRLTSTSDWCQQSAVSVGPVSTLYAWPARRLASALVTVLGYSIMVVYNCNLFKER